MGGVGGLYGWYMHVLFPTAESFGVSAQIGSRAVRCGSEPRFHRVRQGSKRSAACCWKYHKNKPHECAPVQIWDTKGKAKLFWGREIKTRCFQESWKWTRDLKREVAKNPCQFS